MSRSKSKTLGQKVAYVLLFLPVGVCLLPVAYVIDGREGVKRVLRTLKSFRVVP